MIDKWKRGIRKTDPSSNLKFATAAFLPALADPYAFL